jgi:hypothetical protein
MIPGSFLLTHRRPLVMAMLRGNAEMFGSLGDLALKKQQDEVSVQFEQVLGRHGLIRADIPHISYALHAATLGFYVGDTFSEEFDSIPVEEKAAALAHLIRSAFEPPGEPDPVVVAEVAAELSSTLEELVSGYRNGIYAHDPARAPG